MHNVDATHPHGEADINPELLTAKITSYSELATSNKTLPRNIVGLELASSIIDDCFELYDLFLFNRHAAKCDTDISNGII